MQYLNDLTRYNVAWEEKYSTFMVDFVARATAEYPYIIGNNIVESYYFIERTNHVITFYSKKAQEKINREQGCYFLNKHRVERLYKHYDCLIHQHQKLLNEFHSIDLPKMTSAALYHLWQRFSNFFIEMLAYYRSSRPEAEIKPAHKLKNILKLYYPEKKIEEKFRLLTTSPKPTLIDKEHRDWVRILAVSPKSNFPPQSVLIDHVNKYPSFFINLYDFNKILTRIKKRYVDDKPLLKNLQREIADKKRVLENLPQKQKNIVKKCKSHAKMLSFLSEMLQKFGWYRFEVKNLWAGSEIHFLALFQEIERRFKIPLFHLFNYYRLEDIAQAIKKKKTLAPLEIKKRKQCFVFMVKEGKYQYLSGRKAVRLLQEINSRLILNKEIIGSTAYPGKVTGRVRIILPETMEDKRITSQLKMGDILVTTNTQPSMVPLMKKATAIITDIGGITSHSAIVSREFKIPCIVGTKTGSKVLKDGQMVEVDADRGIVRILQPRLTES